MRPHLLGIPGQRVRFALAPFASFVKKAAAIVTAVSLVGGPSAQAALVAGWDFQTTTNGGTATAAQPSTPKVYKANFGSGTLYFDGTNGSSDWYSGSGNTELNAFGGTTINAGTGFSNVTSGAAALALVSGSNNAANGKYGVFKFDMTGYQDLQVSYASQRTSTGFTTLTWDASSDGTNWTPIGTIAAGTSFVASGTLALSTISLLNNSSTAYLRISGSGATASSGNNRLDNIQFNASTYVAPSGTATWVGTGSGGTWSNGGSGKFGSPYSNSLSTAVLFTGTGETVTLSGGIQAGSVSLQPATGSYTLTGGSSLELGPGVNASVASGSGTIASVISGTSGLTKGGAGTLVLGGANTFTGGVGVSQGTLQIAADDALGDAANDVAMTGTLKTTANVTLGSGRDFTGSGTLDVAPGTTLRINGASNLVGTTLANTGTLSLQGSSRAVGGLVLNAAARIEAAGPVSVGNITATGVTSGTAVINAGIAFNSTGDKTFDVGGGGTLVVNGDVTGTSARIAKTGAGTLVVNGSNSSSGYRIGVSGATPVNGGTVVIGSAVGSGTSQMQVNFGTLATSVPGGITVPTGLSVGGRSGAVAVIGGSQPITFSGSSSFFRSFGTSGEMRLDVNNTTTISGTLGATSGSGTASGVTIGGTGRLILAANGVGASGSTSFTDRVTVNSGVTVELSNTTALAAASVDTSGGGTVTVSPYLATTVGGLNPNGGGLVNVGNGSMTVTSGLTVPNMLTAITAGYNGGTWTGTTGITSSTAAANTAAGAVRAIGWLDNGGGSVTFAFAAPGDTNLDGLIDALDAAALSSAGRFNDTAVWSEGDFNYDGIYDDLDNALFVSTNLFDAGYYNAPPGAVGAIAPVPEPSTSAVALVAGLASMLLIRRRRTTFGDVAC